MSYIAFAHNVAFNFRTRLRTELIHIEKQIFDLETIYLEETRDFGNIFIGWESYLSTDKVQKMRKNISVEDRAFSLSSVTSPASRRGEKRSNKEKKKERSEPKKKVKLADADAVPVAEDDPVATNVESPSAEAVEEPEE